jgi:hypothetical protein
MNVPENIKVLLACGVAVIDTFSCKAYNHFVDSLFIEGALAYAVADVRVAYGTNVPLSGIIVTKEFSDKYSFNTVCQLMARVGRVGKSWKGEVYIDESCRNTFVSSFRSGSSELDIENFNLNKLHDDIVLANSAQKQSVKYRLQNIKARALKAAQAKANAEMERIQLEAAKAKAEAEAENAKKAKEVVAIDEAQAIAERKARRSGRPTGTNVSTVLSDPPIVGAVNNIAVNNIAVNNASVAPVRKPVSGFNRKK